jgi:putative Holliday junction resolvase
LTRKLAVDVGAVRIGLAISEGALVLPLETIANDELSWDRISQICSDRSIQAIYVGLPLSLNGSHTASTDSAVGFARTLTAIGLPVQLIDERLSTKSAQRMITSLGKSTKQSRGYIDAQAAAGILEFALQSERNGLAGIAVEEFNA